VKCHFSTNKFTSCYIKYDNRLDFNNKFTNCVKACIESFTDSILINGSPTK